MPYENELLGKLLSDPRIAPIAAEAIRKRDLTREPWFCCHPCRNTSSLRMTTEDMLTRLLPALGHEPVWVELPREDPEA